MQDGLASGTVDNLEHGQVVTVKTLHIVKQMMAIERGAGLGLGLHLGLCSIFVFVLIVVFVLLGGPQKQCWHMLLALCFQALRGLLRIPTSTSAREEINHRKFALVGIIPNQLFSFSSDKDRRTDSRIRLFRLIRLSVLLSLSELKEKS